MCYQTTTRECAMVNPYTGGHGTASYSPVSEPGKTYSGYSNVFVFDNINGCAMTLSCDTGYLAVPGGVLSNYVFKNVNLGDSTALRFRALTNGEGSASQGETGLSAGEWRVTWSDNTYVHGYASCNNTSTNTAQVSALYTQYNNNEITQAQYLDAVIGDNGISVRPASTFNTSSTGSYCWCQMDSYALQGGGAQSIQNSLWREIFSTIAGSASQATETECANGCAYYCALLMGGQTIYRRPFFGSLGATPYCDVNSTIVLNWYNQNTLLDTNSCTYGEAIVFPSETGTRTGYHATGWHVREQQTPENP